MLAELDAATGLHDIRLKADHPKDDVPETATYFTAHELVGRGVDLGVGGRIIGSVQRWVRRRLGKRNHE
jgi:hypothetical protein